MRPWVAARFTTTVALDVCDGHARCVWALSPMLPLFGFWSPGEMQPAVHGELGRHRHCSVVRPTSTEQPSWGMKESVCLLPRVVGSQFSWVSSCELTCTRPLQQSFSLKCWVLIHPTRSFGLFSTHVHHAQSFDDYARQYAAASPPSPWHTAPPTPPHSPPVAVYRKGHWLSFICKKSRKNPRRLPRRVGSIRAWILTLLHGHHRRHKEYLATLLCRMVRLSRRGVVGGL